MGKLWQLTDPLRSSSPGPGDFGLRDSDIMKKTCWWLGVDALIPEPVAKKLPSVFYIMKKWTFFSVSVKSALDRTSII